MDETDKLEVVNKNDEVNEIIRETSNELRFAFPNGDIVSRIINLLSTMSKPEVINFIRCESFRNRLRDAQERNRAINNVRRF